MYITLDILQKRGACQEALDFFAKHYPDGIEMMDMIENGHLPIDFLHWGYQWLDPNEEEAAAYWRKVKVSQSLGIYESYDVTRSELVSKSSVVSNSESVYSSEQINNSDNIVASHYIDDSHHIAVSDFVTNSYYVLGSKNISNSNQVTDSVYVVNSHGIFESGNVLNSHTIWKSENLTNCCFCFGCRNLSNALFCENVSDDEYMLFNKKIDKIRFDMIMKQYKTYASPFVTLMAEWPARPGEYPQRYFDYRRHTLNVSEKFWGWVKTLPGYDSSILYSLTFNPRFLV